MQLSITTGTYKAENLDIYNIHMFTYHAILFGTVTTIQQVGVHGIVRFSSYHAVITVS